MVYDPVYNICNYVPSETFLVPCKTLNTESQLDLKCKKRPKYFQRGLSNTQHIFLFFKLVASTT